MLRQDDWPEIVPLSGSTPAEPFPIEVLPPKVRAMVAAVSASTATPVDFPAVVALGVVSVVSARAVSIRLPGDWTTPANLYVCAVLPSGEGKSPAMRPLAAVLHEIEREWQIEARDEITEAKTRRQIADKLADKAVSDAGRGEGTDADAVKLAQAAAAITVPSSPRLLAMEPTPEALVRLASATGGTVGVVSDEGGEVFQLTSRYSSSGAANLGVYLQGFDGQPYVSDRASRETVRIDRLVLSLVLAVQPSILDDLARDKANSERGLLARFLLCVPASQVGSRPTRRPEIPAVVRQRWDALLWKIAAEVNGRSAPAVLELDDDATEAWWKFCDNVEPRLHPDTGDLRYCVEWGSKAQAHVARLAALLHLADEQPLDAKVSATTMSAAVELWDYFASHARRAFASMTETPDIRIARKVIGWIERTGVDQFTQRDAHRGTASRLIETKDDLQTGLVVLVDRGYLRALPRPPASERGGRPYSPAYAVHPALLADS